MSPPVNSNFYFFERKCPTCTGMMLIAEQDLGKPRVPCARCVKGGTVTYTTTDPIILSNDKELDHDDE